MSRRLVLRVPPDAPTTRRSRALTCPTVSCPRNPAHGEILRRIIATERPTAGALLARPEVLTSVHWQIIGPVDDAFEAISGRFRDGAIDGFVAVPGGSVRSLELTPGALVPRLAEAGLFRSGYRATR
jgi:hypothetical protein